jgi:predicted short-subunit dehydrogenase-like oxidoreductase (DUF2520 family)
VGPGRVGSSLATWIGRRGGRLAAWARRSPLPLPDASGPFRQRNRRRLSEISDAPLDLLLICVPDWEIAGLAKTLGPVEARIALHVSGSLPATVLEPLRGLGAAIGSFHPLWAFPSLVPRPPSGLAAGIDGDPAALAASRRLALAFGASAFEIPSESRLIYHLAATLAAGGVATVAATAAALARAQGLPEALGEGLRALAGSALAGLASPRLDRGFTGPVARGDADLVRAEWRELARFPEFEPLVRELARAMIRRIEEGSGALPGHREIGRFS